MNDEFHEIDLSPLMADDKTMNRARKVYLRTLTPEEIDRACARPGVHARAVRANLEMFGNIVATEYDANCTLGAMRELHRGTEDAIGLATHDAVWDAIDLAAGRPPRKQEER